MSNYILTSPVDILSSGGGGQINLFNSANTFAAQLKAPAALTANVDFTLPATAGTTGQYLQRTGPTSMGWSTNVSASIYYPIQFRTYSDSTNPWTSTGNYFLPCGNIYFPGTTALGGAPKEAFFLNSVSAINIQFTVQVIDILTTNNLGSQTVIGSTGSIPLFTSIALNTSFMSTGPSIWQFQFKNLSGTGVVTIYVIGISF